MIRYPFDTHSNTNQLKIFAPAGPCDGAEPSLVINPEGTVHHKPLGQSLYFQCRPNVENVDLVSEWKWVDPHGNEITGDDR